ncbi:MAG: DUF1844 domain-containing protein [Phycisphaerales bacterium]|nr:DUF1844 domain-containing protein [Phycisphaerales bacterium]
MSDEQRKIIVDDDWKAQAQREKEQLAQQTAERSTARRGAVNPGFVEIVNLLFMQAAAAMGMLVGPGGERMEPNLEAAKLFIDLIQVLEEKTRGNLAAEEKSILDESLYRLRMSYVSLASAAAGGPPPGVAPA